MSGDPYAGLGRVVGSGGSIEGPAYDLQVPKAQSEIYQSGASAGNSVANTNRTTVLTPLEAEEKRLDNQKKQAGLDAAAIKAEQVQSGKVAGARSLQLKMEELLGNIRDARRLVSNRTTGLPGQLLKGLGGSDAIDLAAYVGPTGSISSAVMLGALGDLKKLSPTGASGLGSLNRSEAESLKNSVVSLQQAQSKEQQLNALAKLEKHFRSSYAIANNEDPHEPKVAAKYGIIMEPPKGSKPIPPSGKITGQFDVSENPELRGLNASVGAMLRAGVPAADVRDYLNRVQPHMGDKAESVEWYEDFYRQHPKSKEQPRIDLEKVYTPKKGAAAAIGKVAESPLGAAVIGGTDVLTGGFLDEAAKNPEMTRAVMSGVQEENPGAYLAGQLVGGGLGAAGTGLAAGKLGLSLGPKALAAIEGGVYGAGSADSDSFTDRAVGAGVGAGLGVLGNKVVGGVTKAGGAALAGLRDKYGQLLNKSGVPMTIGEMVGGPLATLEQRYSQTPFLGKKVLTRQAEGVEGFNRAAFDDTLGHIGEKLDGDVAEPGIREAKQKIGSFYDDTVNGKVFQPDQTFTNNTNAILADLGDNVPDVGPNVVRDITKRIGDRLDPARPMTGPEWQSALKDIKRVGRDYKNHSMSEGINRRITGLLGEFEDLAKRSEPDIADNLDAANAAWRKYSIVKDAVRKNDTKAKSIFTPEDLMGASADNAERFGARGASAEGEHPFFDLAKAGANVLTPVTKSEGPMRFITPATATGTLAAGNWYFSGHKDPVTGDVEGRDPVTSALLGLGALGAMGTPYSKIAQKYIQKALLGSRSAGKKKAGELIRDKLSAIVGPMSVAPLYDKYMGSLPRPEHVEDERPIGLPGLDPSMFVLPEPAQGAVLLHPDDLNQP